MIDLSKVKNYYVACGYTDLRRGIDGLAAIVTQQYAGQLSEESLFLFCGRRTDRIKALYWSGDGYILLYKAENAIRPFVVGRKNWLFCDSVKGAESSAIVYSIVETAKANNLEPYDYLLRVLSLLPGKGKSPSHEELERLMPWHPDVQGREVLRKRKI